MSGIWSRPYPLLGYANFKSQPEDFVVEECMGLDWTHHGEHLWVWIEKRDRNTEGIARELSRLFKCSLSQVGYAGLKDKRAVARQWFSIQTAQGADLPPHESVGKNWFVLKSLRHSRKLKRGTHKGNSFTILLRNVIAHRESVDLALKRCEKEGVPNYFGLQRFGLGASNWTQAMSFAGVNKFPKLRHEKSRLLSSARSYLFNSVLSERVKRKTWNLPQQGDLMGFAGSNSFFPWDCSHLPNIKRMMEMDIHPTGPLWGLGTLATQEDIRTIEESVAKEFPDIDAWLCQAGLIQERRPLRLVVHDLSWSWQEKNLSIQFQLVPGGFATEVLSNIFHLCEPSAVGA